MKRERIAVTGVGIVSALGPDAPTSFRRLAAGDRGFGPVSLFDVTGQRTKIAAEIAGLRVGDVAPRGEAESWSRSDAMALLAVREALASARLGPDAPVSVAVGASTGGMYEAEAVLTTMQQGPASEASARRLLSYPLSTTAERIASTLGAVERAITICSACSSGANAIVQAAAWLYSGRSRAVLAGGTDGLCLLTFTGFNSLGAMDGLPCRPFDQARAGMSLGEGASFLVLEPESSARARDARIYAWLSGWAIGAEAHHITHPEPSGRTAARLLGEALERAGLTAADVDYVNAHGTGTPHNDAMEARALRAALGAEAERIRVSSSKGQIGHTLAAAGAIEAAFTVLALEAGIAPPTGGLTTPEPELGLRLVAGRGEQVELRAALSSSFGFGGTGCVLAFERSAAPVRSQPSRSPHRLVITGSATFGALGVLTGSRNADYAEANDAALQKSENAQLPDPLQQLEPARSRRFDRASSLVTLTAGRALEDAGLAPHAAGLIAGTAFGSLERSVEFLRRVAQRGPRLASPADFPHLVPSAPSGNASIYHGMSGPVVSVSDLSTSAESAVALGVSLLELGLAPALVLGSAEPFDAIVARVLGPLCGAVATLPRGEGAGFVVLESEDLAAERRARVLAVVRDHSQRWDDAAAALAGMPAPERPDQAIVVLGASDQSLESALERTEWSKVKRRPVMERCGAHEGAGGFALAAGAGLVALGRASEALVIGAGRGRVYAVLLVPSDSTAESRR
jgi:3-oxoacyl-[acyl-carrier-protein] synthase II